jgi:uncharacterized cupredoxin-like copper-binding protein
MQGRRKARRNAVMCLAATAAVASVVAGCGGSSGSGATTHAAGATQGQTSTGTATTVNGTTVLNIQASASELAYVPNQLSAPAGRITIRVTNPSQLQHSIALAVNGIAPGPVVGHGGVSAVTATLAPGTYTFYCTVPGHRQAGMTGTLTVH